MIVGWIISLWKRFGKALKKDEYLIFWTTLVFYFLLFFNPNNKTLVLFFFLYLFFLYYFTKDFKKSLLLAFLASWPFNVGKTYVFEFVPAWKLNLPFRPYGIATNIMISIKEIFLVLMLLTLIRDFLLGRKDIFKFEKLSILLLLYFFSLVLASVIGSIRPEISLAQSLYSISPLIVYFYIRNLSQEGKSFFFSSIAVLSTFIILETTLAGLQFINHNPLGLSIEESQDFLPVDPSLEAGILAYRPVGTFSHANMLAHFLLPLLFVFLPVAFFKFKRLDKIATISFLLAFLTFLLTLGRSAWVSFFIAIVGFFFVVEKKWHLKLRLRKEVIKPLIFSLPATLPFLIFFLGPRLINTFYAFEIYGGGYARTELIKGTWEIIKQFPLFGVGLNMDIFYSYQRSLERFGSIFSYFPERVHNGYLGLLVQVGIFPLLFFLLISVIIFRKLIKYINRGKLLLTKTLFLSLVFGFLSLYLNCFLQPFLPNLHEMIFLSMIYISKQEKTVILEKC